MKNQYNKGYDCDYGYEHGCAGKPEPGCSHCNKYKREALLQEEEAKALQDDAVILRKKAEKLEEEALALEKEAKKLWEKSNKVWEEEAALQNEAANLLEAANENLKKYICCKENEKHHCEPCCDCGYKCKCKY